MGNTNTVYNLLIAADDALRAAEKMVDTSSECYYEIGNALTAISSAQADLL